LRRLQRRHLVLLLVVLGLSAAALAVTGLVLGRHVVEVEPGPPVVLDYNGSTVVVAAPYSRQVVAEPARAAGRQLSPCVKYTLQVTGEGVEDYRYLAVLVAGNSSVGLYADPRRPVSSAVLCAETPAEVVLARSVVVEAGRGRGRLEATLTAEPVEPGRAEASYWPAWARPGAYARYTALIGTLEVRVLDAEPGYAVVEQRVSGSLGLGFTNTTRARIGFDEVREDTPLYTRAALEKLLDKARDEGCRIARTTVDVAGRSGVEALEIACSKYTLYVSPSYGLLLKAYGQGAAMELVDTNILPLGGEAPTTGELWILPASRAYSNGTLVLIVKANTAARIVKIEACGHTLPGTQLQPGTATLVLRLPEPPQGDTCNVKLYTETGNVYTAGIKVEG